MSYTIKERAEMLVEGDEIEAVYHRRLEDDFDHDASWVRHEDTASLPESEWKEGHYDALVLYASDRIQYQYGRGYDESTGSLPRSPDLFETARDVE